MSEFHCQLEDLFENLINEDAEDDSGILGIIAPRNDQTEEAVESCCQTQTYFPVALIDQEVNILLDLLNLFKLAAKISSVRQNGTEVFARINSEFDSICHSEKFQE